MRLGVTGPGWCASTYKRSTCRRLNCRPAKGGRAVLDLAAQTDDRGQDLGDPLSPITGTLSATELPPLDRRHLRR
jgi:hypothetical protein